MFNPTYHRKRQVVVRLLHQQPFAAEPVEHLEQQCAQQPAPAGSTADPSSFDIDRSPSSVSARSARMWMVRLLAGCGIPHRERGPCWI